MTTRRAPENPILTPSALRPSRDDFEVVGVFNPAAVRAPDGEIVLLLRVAEAPRDLAADVVGAPVFDAACGRVIVKTFRRDAPGVDLSDTRTIVVGGETWLTSLSHFRVARSRDGVRFTVDDAPAFAAALALESFGVEDPRITALSDGTWVMNYTAVSEHGIATGVATCKAGEPTRWERRGVAFAPQNRDVTIFPEKAGPRGTYAALHRPMPDGIGRPAIWYATSPDLLRWGDHRFVAGRRAGAWDDLKVGGGAPPFRFDAGGKRGWLAIYHGVTADPLTYSLGALLLDERDPSVVIGRSRAPILAPEAPFEVRGFFGNVVFTCGTVLERDAVRIYYGAADGVTAVADVPLEDIAAGLE